MSNTATSGQLSRARATAWRPFVASLITRDGAAAAWARQPLRQPAHALGLPLELEVRRAFGCLLRGQRSHMDVLEGLDDRVALHGHLADVRADDLAAGHGADVLLDLDPRGG